MSLFDSMKRCNDCGTVAFPDARRCPKCNSVYSSSEIILSDDNTKPKCIDDICADIYDQINRLVLDTQSPNFATIDITAKISIPIVKCHIC